MAEISIRCDHIVNGALPHVCVRCGKPAVTNRFSWVSNPKTASWYLSRGMKVWGLLFFWVLVLWKEFFRREAQEVGGGLPVCERHRNYWMYRAWFNVGGFFLLVLLFGLAIATDPPNGSIQQQAAGSDMLSMAAGFWLFAYPLGFLIAHLSAMRVARHDGHRVKLVGVSKQFISALKESHPEYAAEKKPTHWEQFRQVVGDYNR